MRFRNHYACPCGTEWTDEWSADCDDRCPSCNTSCSPSESEDIREDEDDEEWEPAGYPRPPLPVIEAPGFLAVAAELVGPAPSNAPKRTVAPVATPTEATYTQLDMFGGNHG